jgi:hypothetical protein
MNYHYLLRNNPEGRGSRLLRGGSLTLSVSVLFAILLEVAYSIQYKHSFVLSSITSYMFRLMPSHHQADRENNEKIFAPACEVRDLENLQKHFYLLINSLTH